MLLNDFGTVRLIQNEETERTDHCGKEQTM